MAVAALSAPAIALPTAPAAAPSSAAGETAEAFATLVSRAQPDGRTPQGEPKPQSAENETEIAEVPSEKAATSADGETKAAPTEKVDLLAELEAIFAAAAQIGVATPMPLTTAAAPLAPTITVTPDSAAATPETVSSPKAAMAAQTSTAPLGSSIAAPPAPADSFASKVADLAVPIDPAATTEQPTLPAPPVAAEPVADAAATTTTLRRDIAAIVASLKAAFHPAGADSESPVAEPISPTPAPAPSAMVMPFAQTPPAATPIPAAAMPVVAMRVVAMPVAGSPAPVPIGEDAEVREPVISATSPEAVKKAAIQPAPKAVVPVSIEHIVQAAVTRAAEIAAPFVALAEPAVSSAEETAPTAAPTIASAPLAVAPLIPAAVTPTSWAEAPVTDIANAPAPNHAEQSVVRHLDLARDTQWLDQLARDISQSAAQQGHLKFQLNPEHLGALTVEIANSAAGTAIKLSAETDQARAIIADAQPRLLAEVRAQGLRVSESHVDLSQQGSSGSAFAQGQQRQSSEDSKPFVRTQTLNRDDAGDSAPREDGELYA